MNIHMMLPMLIMLTAVWGNTPPPSHQQALPADLETMHRDTRCGQVIVTCMIGEQPMRMMLDTGASHTVLHQESTRQISQIRWLDTSQMHFQGNAAQRPKIAVSSLQVANISVPEHPFMVLNLEAVRSAMETRIDGILGMDVLGALPFTFDLKTNSFYWGTPKEGKVEQLRGKQDCMGRYIVHAQCCGKQIPLLLDTGSSVTRVREEDWLPGVAGSVSAQTGDVNTTASRQLLTGKPAHLEIAAGIELKDVTPILMQDNLPPVLGMDALKDQVLIHMPTEDSPYGVFLLMK